MKVNAINSYSANYTLPRFSLNKSPNMQNIAFNGAFDVFKKQKTSLTDEEKQIDNDIKILMKSSVRSDRMLKCCGVAFFLQLKQLLRKGLKSNYQNSISYIDAKGRNKNVTFSEVDKDLKLPSVINIWEKGNLKTVYEIYSTEPQAVYHVSDYKEDGQTEYNFVGDKNIGYFFCSNDGLVIKQYPSETGFLQLQAKRIDDNEAELTADIYYDYKNPEKSHYIENSEEGFVEYNYNKKQNMWFKKRVIPPEEYAEIEDKIKD